MEKECRPERRESPYFCTKFVYNYGVEQIQYLASVANTYENFLASPVQNSAAYRKSLASKEFLLFVCVLYVLYNRREGAGVGIVDPAEGQQQNNVWGFYYIPF